VRFNEKEGRKCIIIYLGDHDPSGLNMPNDIQKKMSLFGATVDIQRIALTMQQIKEYGPPPNTAKESDTRVAAYIAKHGSHVWELDALKPEVLDALITAAIKNNRDPKKYNQAIKKQETERESITALLPFIERKAANE
jgi:hypothetical protein